MNNVHSDKQLKPKTIRAERTVLLLLIGIAVIAGAGLRLYRVGAGSFWLDELWHVHAAESLLETGKPVLPSGHLYTRALPFTYLVAASFKFFGIHEISARLPAVIFGILAIVLTFFVMRKWSGAVSGVVAALLIATAPLCVEWSRECRMYSLFQCLYLALAYFFYESLESVERKARTRIFMGIAAVCMLWISLAIHQLTLLFMPTVAAYLGIMFLVWPSSGPKRSFPSSKYAFLLIAGGLTVLVVFLFKGHSIVPPLWQRITYAPEWGELISRKAYYKILLDRWYPMLVLAYPLAVLVMCLKDIRKGIYMACLFTVPFILHSFLFRWKTERYFLYCFQFFLLGLSPLIAWVCTAIWAAIGRHVEGMKTARTICGLRWLVLPFVLFAFYPAFRPSIASSLRIARTERWAPWKTVYRAYADRITENDLVVSSEPASLRFYGMKNDQRKLNNFSLYEAKKETREDRVAYLDKISGAPLITNLEEFLAAVSTPDEGNVWFMITNYGFKNKESVPDDIRAYLILHATWYQDGKAVDFSDLKRTRWNDILVARIGRKGLA